MVCGLALAGNLTYVDKVWNLNNNRLALIHDGSNLDFPAFFRYSLGPYFLAIGTLAPLAIYVLAWAYPTFPGDEGALLQFQAMRNGWLDHMAIWLANLGLIWVFLRAAVALLTVLTLTRRYADAVMLMGGLAVIGIGNGLKVIVDRPRPDYAVLESLPSSLSFPSGHSFLAVIPRGVLVYLVGLWVKPLLLRRSLKQVWSWW